MATDIVQTLFGITPEGYERQQAAAADQRALAIAQLTPMQRAEFNIGRGAYQLAGALGGTDPELARISMRQSLARQINFNDPTSIQAGVQALTQAGDTMGAMMLADTARKAASESALMVQRNAAAAASLAQAGQSRQQAIPADILKAREIDRLNRQRDLLASSGGEAQEIAYVDAQLAELRGLKEVQGSLVNASGNVVYQGQAKIPSVGTDREAIAQAAPFNKPYAQLTPEEKARVNAIAESQATARARAGATTVSMTQEKAEKSARGKMLVEDYAAIANQARVAARSLPAIEGNLNILDKGFSTGFGTETVAAAAKVLAAFGVKDAEKYATDAQTFLANASAAVLQRQLEQKGPQTEADAQRITQTGAQLGTTKEASRFLLNVAKAQYNRDLRQRTFYDKWYKTEKTYDGAEDAWYSGEGGKSLFDSPELKKYAGGGAAAQIPTTVAPAIPQAAIDALRTGRGTKAQFDQLFGAGAADRVLGGK